MNQGLIRLGLLVVGVCAVACLTPVDPTTKGLTSNVSDWRDEVIYQIVTDRFFDGDVSNNGDFNLSDPSAYHGGDWKGIQNKLDYLVELGVTALWISPVVKNVESDAGFSSYHGYWTQDFTRPNPHFGDVIALREMVDAAHARGLKVILDIVTNHVGQAFYYDINKNGQPDDVLIGQGDEIGYPIGQEEPTSDLVRITEWDPDFNVVGIEAWTSLGPSGLAPIEFLDDPAINRVPPEPAIFAEPFAYNRKGRVTVWNHPQSCDCTLEGVCSWTGEEHCALARSALGEQVCSCDPMTQHCSWSSDQSCKRAQEVLGDFPGGLKDIATTRQDVRDALFKVFADWIDIGDFDGFRIDTLKHVEPGFWEDFCPRIREYAASKGKENFFMFGEAFDGSDEILGSYTQGQGVDSVFYFSQYYEVFRRHLQGEGERTCEIERLHCRRVGCAADPCAEEGSIESLYNARGKTSGITSEDGSALNAQQTVVNFSENHDVGRLLYFLPTTFSPKERRELLHLGLGYLLTVEGIPSLYYGVEQEFEGGNDPANRETMWSEGSYTTRVWEDERWIEVPKAYDSTGDGVNDRTWAPFDTGNPTFVHLQRLIALRKAHVSLRRGAFKGRWSTRAPGGEDHGIFAFERVAPEETTLVVLNYGKVRGSSTLIGGDSMVVSFPAGTTLVDALEPGRTFQTTHTGCVAGSGESCVVVSVPARKFRVLLPQ